MAKIKKGKNIAKIEKKSKDAQKLPKNLDKNQHRIAEKGEKIWQNLMQNRKNTKKS